MGLDQTIGVNGEEPIGCWRKHPDLHGWMEWLWRCKRIVAGEVRKSDPEAMLNYFFGEATAAEVNIFNQVDLPLTEEDILACIKAIRNDELPHTDGFFFGESDRTEEQRQEDLGIMEKCLEAVRQGKEVVYWSWW